MVDRLHSYGIKDAVVYGIVFNGYHASTYILRLVAEGVYIMVEHRQLYMMRNPQDVSCIPNIYQDIAAPCHIQYHQHCISQNTQ